MEAKAEQHQKRAGGAAPSWHVIDADGKTLGRMSSEIAVILQGKHKPAYVSYLNTGDYVIVVNVEKIRVTGNKLDQKTYYRHSGYHGGLKETSLRRMLTKTPTRVIRAAVKGMLPKNRLGRRMLSRLKLYSGAEHPHGAQVNARPKLDREKTEAVVMPESSSPGSELTDSPPAEVEAPTPARRQRAAKPRKSTAAAETSEQQGQSPSRSRGKTRSTAQATDDAATAEEAPPAPKRKRASSSPRRPRSGAGKAEVPETATQTNGEED